MSAISKILVYGATAPQSRPVAEQLLASGFAVRVIARDPAKASDLAQLGAEVVKGDYLNQASLDAASQGIDGVYLFTPFLDPNPAYGAAAVAAAQAAGVKLIVWNPTGPVLPVDTGNPGLDVRRATKAALAASGIAHITLQPTAYMENFLQPAVFEEVKAEGRFAYPIPLAATVQWITHRDVAAFAVEAFKRPELGGQTFDVSGPERLNGGEIAERFSKALGRAITFREMPPEEFGGHLDRAHGPGAGAGVTAFYSAVYADPSIFSTNVDFDSTIAALPITPTYLEQWVRSNSATFA